LAACPNIAPYGETLTCTDGGQIVLAVGNQAQFENLCHVLNLTALPTDEKYNNNSKRVTNRESLLAQLQHSACVWQRDELLAALLSAQVPAGAIRNMQEVFAQPNAQKLINKETIAGIETQRPATAIFTITH
jgi:crotonobetainyl-CoA:carnitine CoA-transferase CaiB-like acyl-CoA transferase